MKDLALSLFPKTIFIGHLNNSKKQIDEYVERNTELLDRMFLDFDIC